MLVSAIRLAVLLACVGATAFGAPLKWSITGTFEDGGTITGSYSFDASTSTYSSVAVQTTEGSIRSGASYTLYDPCCAQDPGFLLFVTTTGNLTGTPVLSAMLVGNMTNAGGTINLATAASGLSWFSEEDCVNSTCTGPVGATRRITSGYVTTVPEPGTFIVALPLAAIALLIRKRNRNQ